MVEIGRLVTAMITPFDEGGQVNYDEAKRIATALIDSGTDSLVVTGTTGESPALSGDEKLRLYSEIKSAVGDRAAVIAGTADNDTIKSIELSRGAEQAGADAILLSVPAYNKPPQEGLPSHPVPHLPEAASARRAPTDTVSCPAFPKPLLWPGSHGIAPISPCSRSPAGSGPSSRAPTRLVVGRTSIVVGPKTCGLTSKDST